MSNLFGGSPSMPAVKTVKQPTQITQTDEERKRIMKEFAKRKRATMLSQMMTSQANISRQKLGAGV